MIRFKLTGVKEAIRDLKDWEVEKIRESRLQIERSAINIEREAKNACPVDVEILRSSIAKKVTATDSGRVLEAEVGTVVEYAPFVEFGTGDGASSIPAELQEYASEFKGKTGRVRNYPARPFLFPAWEKERPQFIKRMEAILAKR
jgi:HK97 gp10 family phage protein